MPDDKDSINGTVSGSIDRRRLLQLTGVGIVSGGLASSVASGADSELSNAILIDGSISEGESAYELLVSGLAEPHPEVGGAETDGGHVSGLVESGRDAYRFSGTLSYLDVSGRAEVTIYYGEEIEDPETDRFEIVAGNDGEVDYTFTSEDEVEKVLDAGDRSASESNDSVMEGADGSWTVDGSTANGNGDTYALHGAVTNFEPVTGNFTLFLNGEEVTIPELTGQEMPEADEGEEEEGEEEEPQLQVNELTISSTAETPAMFYEFAAEGAIEAGDNTRDHDDVIESDGDWHVEGQVGPNGTDTYRLEGKVESWDVVDRDGDYVEQSRFALYWNGEIATLDDILTGDRPTRELTVVADEEIDYGLKTSGEISTVQDGEYPASDDVDPEETDDGSWIVRGSLEAGAGDTFEFAGQALDFAPKDAEVSIYLAGEELTPYELVGEEPPRDISDVAIGGGPGYEDAVTRSEADFVVSSRSELSSALSSASSGDIVFIEGDTNIDMGSSSYTVSSGVTLASNRGVNSSDGAYLYTDSEPSQLFTLQQNARVTGIQMRGARPGGDTGGSSGAKALSVSGDDVEIDNCDIWGFPYAGIFVRSGDAHIHHNVLRECNKSGLGYGVSIISGNPLMEYNYFNFNRHSVATDGSNYGYVCRYNHFGPRMTSHHIDMHEPAGTRYEVYNNVVEGYIGEDGGQRSGVAVRGSPSDVAMIDDNWFWNPDPPRSTPNGWSSREAIIQVGTSSWQNVSFSGNYYGEDANASFSDIIPEYDGDRS